MKKIFILLVLTPLLLFSQSKEEIINKFQNFVDSKKIIQYSIVEIMDDEAKGISEHSANCTFVKASEDTIIGFYYDIKMETMTSVYNSKEYLEYYPEIYGDKTVKVVSKKNNPREFNKREIVWNGKTSYMDPLPKSNIFYYASIIGHYNGFKNDSKEVKDKGNWIVLPDTIVNGIQCLQIIYKTPFIYEDETDTATATYSFDKQTGMLVHYKFFHPVQQREELYSDFIYDNPKASELITRKAFPKGTKFLEHPKRLIKKEQIPLKVNTKAPEWELTNLKEKKINLEDLQGSPVFLVYSEIGCVPCMSAIPVFNELATEYPKVKIISIYSKDNKDALIKLAEKKKIAYDILYNQANDDAKKVSDGYHITGYPTYFLIDKKGIIRYTGCGYGDGMKTIWEKEIQKVLK